MTDDDPVEGIVNELDRRLAEVEALGGAFSKASLALNDLGQEILVASQRADGEDERVYSLLMMGKRIAGIAADLHKEGEAWLKRALV